MKKKFLSVVITIAMCLLTIITPSHIAYATSNEAYQGIFMKDGIFISVTLYSGIEPGDSIGVVNHVTEPYIGDYGYVECNTYQELGEIYQNREKYIIKSEYHDEYGYIEFKKGSICISDEIINPYNGEYIQVSNAGANMSPDMVWLDIPKRNDKTIVTAYISILEEYEENGDWGKFNYTVQDIDNDGEKELIILSEYGYDFFTYKDNKVIFLYNLDYSEIGNKIADCKWCNVLDYSLLDGLHIEKPIKVILNGTELSFDQPPIMENDRVMVPIRAIFEALGYGLEWNQNTQTAIATKGNNKLSVPEGLSGLYVDDEWLSFDVPNINISGRILVPVRVVAQCAGAEVEWDGENQSVLIDYDSITADKRVSILKYALFCDNHIKNIFTTEKYTYQTFYQDMYIDNIYSGIAVDIVAKYLVDEAADKEKYIDVVTTLLNMADFTIEDNIEKQHEFDTYKTFGEYAWDVGEIMIGTISPEGNKKLEVIKNLIDADSEAINITIDSIEKYERLNKIQLETEYKMTILDILEEGSIDDNLTAACQEIRDAEKKKVLLELDILNESLTDVAEYLANDVLFKQMAFPLMKQSDAYANDETLKLIVDKGDDLYKKADDCLGALKTGFKLGLFAGDMILGTTDTINRVTEMKALAIIRLSFGSNLASQLANPLNSSKNVDEAYEELINIIPLIKFVDNIHLRGEYCMYKLMSEDQQLLSLIYDLSGDNLENLNKWWDNTKSDLIWYDHKLSSICQ